jgi:hypothetical protein
MIYRWVFNISAAVSLLLCVAISVSWVRSYSMTELAGWYRIRWSGNTCQSISFGYYSELGGMRFFFFDRTGTIDTLDSATYLRKPADQFSMIHESPSEYPYMDQVFPGVGRLGFGIYHGPRKTTLWALLPTGAGYGPDSGAPDRSRFDAPPIFVPMRTDNDIFILVPDWFLVTMSAVLPTYWVARRRNRARRARLELCRGCGYNLTGNASGVCPECGVVISAKTKC